MDDINLFQLKNSIYLKTVKSKSEVSKKYSCDGFLIDSSEKEARRIIESLKNSGKKIAVIGGDDAFNRRAVESLKINYLVSPEKGNKKDNLKQRDSGINHVVAKIAKEKGIVFVVDMSEVAGLKDKEKVLRLGRIIQNIKICRKVGCGIKIASLTRNKKNIIDERGRKSFGVSLGMSSVQSVDAVQF